MSRIPGELALSLVDIVDWRLLMDRAWNLIRLIVRYSTQSASCWLPSQRRAHVWRLVLLMIMIITYRSAFRHEFTLCHLPIHILVTSIRLLLQPILEVLRIQHPSIITLTLSRSFTSSKEDFSVPIRLLLMAIVFAIHF